jgi:hypothetical protein
VDQALPVAAQRLSEKHQSTAAVSQAATKIAKPSTMKNMRRLSTLLTLCVVGSALLVGCGSDNEAPTAPTATEVVAVSPTEAPSATAAPSPTATPEVVRQDIRATRLSIPVLGIDSEVQGSMTVPYTYVPPPGCPPRDTEETQTVTVPNQGIATPADNLEGLENRAWIFGHSRWLGVEGLFYGLLELNPGDELFIDGVDRDTGAAISGKRFVVDGLYLADTDSGETLLNAEAPEDIPAEPEVVLQTSVREDGAGKPWILDQATLLAKATNTVEGDLDDPCKYLLLFVTARPAP